MTDPLTPQQIAGLKELAIYQGTENSVFARLIATIEARDAAFDAMLEALRSTKEGMEDGYECDSYPEICSAIAQAEKVK